MSFKGHTSKMSSEDKLYFRFDILNRSCILFPLFAKQLPCEVVGIPSSLSFVIKRVFVFFIHCNVSINKNQKETFGHLIFFLV